MIGVLKDKKFLSQDESYVKNVEVYINYKSIIEHIPDYEKKNYLICLYYVIIVTMSFIISMAQNDDYLDRQKLSLNELNIRRITKHLSNLMKGAPKEILRLKRQLQSLYQIQNLNSQQVE